MSIHEDIAKMINNRMRYLYRFMCLPVAIKVQAIPYTVSNLVLTKMILLIRLYHLLITNYTLLDLLGKDYSRD
jgi:hypothetical protein